MSYCIYKERSAASKNKKIWQYLSAKLSNTNFWDRQWNIGQMDCLFCGKKKSKENRFFLFQSFSSKTDVWPQALTISSSSLFQSILSSSELRYSQIIALFSDVAKKKLWIGGQVENLSKFDLLFISSQKWCNISALKAVLTEKHWDGHHISWDQQTHNQFWQSRFYCHGKHERICVEHS